MKIKNNLPGSDQAIMQKVIICNNARRGTGKDEDSPVRMIIQVFTLDGQLIAENDQWELDYNRTKITEYKKRMQDAETTNSELSELNASQQKKINYQANKIEAMQLTIDQFNETLSNQLPTANELEENLKKKGWLRGHSLRNPEPVEAKMDQQAEPTGESRGTPRFKPHAAAVEAFKNERDGEVRNW